MTIKEGKFSGCATQIIPNIKNEKEDPYVWSNPERKKTESQRRQIKRKYYYIRRQDNEEENLKTIRK